MNTNTMNSVDLVPNVNMSAVMREFAASEGTRVIRAVYHKGERGDSFHAGLRAHWKIQFVGPTPDLFGLVQ